MTTLTLDHVLIAVRDLDAATESYRRLLGLAPSWRGRHPAQGTANTLFRLRDTYIELLAGAGTGDSPWLQALNRHLDERGEGLYGIALGTDDIVATVATARDRGLEVAEPVDGGGEDERTGARREWTFARMPRRSTRGVDAFFIQHRSPRDALPPAQPETDGRAYATGVDHIVVASSLLAETLRLWRDQIGLDLRRTMEGAAGRTLHFLRLGGSVLELAGDAEPERPGEHDLLWGIAYNVEDAGATVDRLRGLGIDVSDARNGRAPNTMVADLKPGYSHDVRTLLIQKELP